MSELRTSKQKCTCALTCARKGRPFPAEWSWQCQQLEYLQPWRPADETTANQIAGSASNPSGPSNQCPVTEPWDDVEHQLQEIDWYASRRQNLSQLSRGGQRWADMLADDLRELRELINAARKSEMRPPPVICARIHQGNEVIVDGVELAKIATVRITCSARVGVPEEPKARRPCDWPNAHVQPCDCSVNEPLPVNGSALNSNNEQVRK